ncbi:protein translocase subunit SecF [uncultured Nocardioides sp.]|uniref:protein translocase subunit SecF n=1 Tax=uncultured Nocardioides sp. TaxID=198441 RepID=UPI0025E12681|nr:protein translocase subunit SecF [uncultured Nocardioides sp.]
MGKFSRLGNDLYGGRKSYDFVHKKTLWYAVSGLLVAGAIAVVLLRGLNFGIEFTGGTQYKVSLPAAQVTQTSADTVREAVAGAGVAEAESPIVTTAGEAILVQVEELTQEESDQVTTAIEGSIDGVGDISQDEISASWGQEVAQRAALGVTVFLVLVMIFIGVYFREWKMSVAAFVALFHDIAITVGVYALSGFQVTPSAVTGLLAILGFSLYDTVVVFDKVKENTLEMSKTRQTYAEAANLAVNQTLVRSINTGIVALIPIGAILYVSAVQLGSSSLQDLALSQFVGMAVGVYSSIFLAPRVLVHLKANETEVVLAEKRARARARAAADKYAAVPTTHASDRPVVDGDPDELADELADEDERAVPAGSTAMRTAPPRRPEAAGRGRIAPEARGPVGPSAASGGRNQPSRKPRSKRGRP